MTNRIDKTLNSIIAKGDNILSPFLTIGYPDLDTSFEISKAIISSGADMLELGIPFSDPLAEGHTIQKTSYQALQNGVTVSTGFEIVRKIRDIDTSTPLVIMGYFNPFFQYGQENVVVEASDAGVDGFIIPDLPWEESEHFNNLCLRKKIHLIPLLTPTSTDERINKVCERASGFVYCVSVTGVTGARLQLNKDLPSLVSRIRKNTNLPILVGFGVSSRSHVETISGFADGVVVGAALLDSISNAKNGNVVLEASEFIKSLKGN
mgnify:FL=1|tara:strand:+ start:5280 stop:6071 length:792 start_codon:yes stop_codon:yes gene_type:complete